MSAAPPVLETERLRLRRWRDDDVDAYAALCADPEVMRFFGAAGETYSREQAAAQLARFRAHWDEHGMTVERTTTHPEYGYTLVVYELDAP